MGAKRGNSKVKHASLGSVFREHWRYAWNSAKFDLLRRPWSTVLTVMVIAISLTLPTTCYLLWKNVNTAANQWYPTPQLTVYLDLSLSDEEARLAAEQLTRVNGVESMTFLSRVEALTEFREWSGFGDAIEMLDENPLPAVAMLLPTEQFESPTQLQVLRERVRDVSGVYDVRLDDGWFTRLTALTGLVALIAGLITALMIVAVFLVIGNSIRLSIFSRRDTINVMKLIGATDGFIMRPFLNSGAVLGLVGALATVVLSQLLIWGLSTAVSNAASVFSAVFHLQGLSWEEALLLILVATMIGWTAAWLATMQHLRHFSPE